jgi:hypothetical protein
MAKIRAHSPVALGVYAPNTYLSGDEVFLGKTWQVEDIRVKSNAPPHEGLLPKPEFL